VAASAVSESRRRKIGLFAFVRDSKLGVQPDCCTTVGDVCNAASAAIVLSLGV
jgi:hypothetical protein